MGFSIFSWSNSSNFLKHTNKALNINISDLFTYFPNKKLGIDQKIASLFHTDIG